MAITRLEFAGGITNSTGIAKHPYQDDIEEDRSILDWIHDSPRLPSYPVNRELDVGRSNYGVDCLLT